MFNHLIITMGLKIINLMEQIKKLYEKTKQSLLCTNKNNPDKGIQLMKEVQTRIKYLKQQHPDLMKQLYSLEVISLNNLACSYNRKGKYKASLYHLQIASEIQSQIFKDINNSTDPESLHQVATTHSNKCAVLSQMNDHQKAYKQISIAIQLLLKTEKTKKSDALVVFYFNGAVELEYLNRLNQALKMAQKGHYLSATANKQMESRFVELIQKLEDKIKKREKKIAKMMLENMKMRNSKSIRDQKSIGRRGNSLNLISQFGAENVEHSGISNEISKQFATYYTKMPKLGSKNIRTTQYPMVRMPVFNESSKKLGQALGLQQRKKVISLYSPQRRQTRIPRNQRLNLRKRENTLQKIMNQQSIF